MSCYTKPPKEFDIFFFEWFSYAQPPEKILAQVNQKMKNF